LRERRAGWRVQRRFTCGFAQEKPLSVGALLALAGGRK